MIFQVGNVNKFNWADAEKVVMTKLDGLVKSLNLTQSRKGSKVN